MLTTDLTPEALAALDREARKAEKSYENTPAEFGVMADFHDALVRLYRAGKLVHVDAKGDRHE